MIIPPTLYQALALLNLRRFASRGRYMYSSDLRLSSYWWGSVYVIHLLAFYVSSSGSWVCVSFVHDSADCQLLCYIMPHAFATWRMALGLTLHRVPQLNVSAGRVTLEFVISLVNVVVPRAHSREVREVRHTYPTWPVLHSSWAIQGFKNVVMMNIALQISLTLLLTVRFYLVLFVCLF